MKRYRNLILIFIITLTMFSCGPKKLSVSYSNTCFNADNEIVYLKTHSYEYFNIGYIDDGYTFDKYRYICKMDLEGNEEVYDIIPEEIAYKHISEGNGAMCIHTHYYEAYTYASNEFTKLLENVYIPVISFNGERIAYGKETGNTTNIHICDFDGANDTGYTAGTPLYWLPDNQQLVYTYGGGLLLMDSSTSNTQVILYEYKWSHDMQRIAYYDDTDHLVLMNWDETGQVVTDWNVWEHKIEWSYDGEYLLSGFHLLDKNGNYIRTLRETD